MLQVALYISSKPSLEFLCQLVLLCSTPQACVGSLTDMRSLLLGEHLSACQERFQAPCSLSRTASVTSLCIVQAFSWLLLWP